MKGSIRLCSIKSVVISVHFTFLLLIGWLIVMNIYSGLHPGQMLWSLLFFIAIFFSLVLHEVGHALVGAQFGINARWITFYPVGGIASIDKLPDNPGQELPISLAGVFVSTLIGSTLVLFSGLPFSLNDMRAYTGIIDSSNFIYSLGVLNIAIAVINLIPAFPLDGGRVFRALLGFKYNYIRATAIVGHTGRIVAFLLIITGLFSYNFFVSLLGLYILAFASDEASYFNINELVKGIFVRDVVMYDYNNMNVSTTINEAANLLAQNHSRYFIVMDDNWPVGIVNRMEIIKAVAEMKYDTTVSEVMKENTLFYDASKPVLEVMDELSAHEGKIYPVMEGDHFIGVISFQNIIEHLILQKSKTREYQKARSLAELV
ncbi:site-2 protease family protein [Flavisolibacter ginsengisoli]|uniref:Zinc metalloprotease n=1 Tax=Flavisolibacter ginsengisoli DSM 18119 TaxID=1121884 RepID=A0A1M4UTW8_9BACT|nr:site-2 protease family protein [Flavisolibacter ginsengisoli]SHE60129.1 Zn-dependent protease (includes SpoIVFB) [Flavisolibacter ginsengisoli DSM 18119]